MKNLIIAIFCFGIVFFIILMAWFLWKPIEAGTVFEVEAGSEIDSSRQNTLEDTNLNIKQPAAKQTGDYYEKAAVNLNGTLYTEFERDQMIIQFKEIFEDGKALTADFNNEVVSDADMRDALLVDYVERCGALNLKRFTGSIPMTPDTMAQLFNAIGISCE